MRKFVAENAAASDFAMKRDGFEKNVSEVDENTFARKFVVLFFDGGSAIEM